MWKWQEKKNKFSSNFFEFWTYRDPIIYKLKVNSFKFIPPQRKITALDIFLAPAVHQNLITTMEW